MMYSEFVKGTGCKETTHNFEVYCNLEAMYMHTDMTKEQVYEYGKKLVDNSLTPAEIEMNKEITARIDTMRFEITGFVADAKMYDEFAKTESDPFWRNNWREDAKRKRDMARSWRAQIAVLKTLLYV